MASGVTYIGGDFVRSHLKWEPLITEVETAMKLFSLHDGKSVVQPVRQSLTIPQHDGWLGLMPALITHQEKGILATKLVTLYPRNSALNIPTHNAVVVLFDSATGCIKAILDGEVITEMRTAAASAVAVKHLANRTKTIAVLGAGTQARSHIEAFLQTFDVKEVRIWNYKPAHAQATDLSTKMRSKHPAQIITVCEHVKDAVKEADVIVTATTAREPILKRDWVKTGALITAVGAPKPEWQELDPELMKASMVVADSREAAMKESGDVIKSGAEIHAELGEVIAGKAIRNPEKITIFKSLGMAIQDAVAADLVFQEYVKGQVK